MAGRISDTVRTDQRIMTARELNAMSFETAQNALSICRCSGMERFEIPGRLMMDVVEPVKAARLLKMLDQTTDNPATSRTSLEQLENGDWKSATTEAALEFDTRCRDVALNEVGNIAGYVAGLSETAAASRGYEGFSLLCKKAMMIPSFYKALGGGTTTFTEINEVIENEAGEAQALYYAALSGKPEVAGNMFEKIINGLGTIIQISKGYRQFEIEDYLVIFCRGSREDQRNKNIQEAAENLLGRDDPSGKLDEICSRQEERIGKYMRGSYNQQWTGFLGRLIMCDGSGELLSSTSRRFKTFLES
jgi:hypothetical protein